MCEFLTRTYQNGLALNTIARFYWSIAIDACLVEQAASACADTTNVELYAHAMHGRAITRILWICVATTLQHQSAINYRYWYGRCLEVVMH